MANAKPAPIEITRAVKDGNLVTRKGGFIFIDVSKNIRSAGDNDKRDALEKK